jgi:hypothetical protein
LWNSGAYRLQHADQVGAAAAITQAYIQMCNRARHGVVRVQMSRPSWIRAPDGGCFGLVIVGYPATACTVES